MIAWFLAIGACGVVGIADHPEILKAQSPTYAAGFLCGHFGTAFFALAAVVLAVTGAEAHNISSPFFLLVPGWGPWPMVLLATAATVIASQAVITGVYSVTSQAAQLGYLPRLRIAHTSESAVGWGVRLINCCGAALEQSNARPSLNGLPHTGDAGQPALVGPRHSRTARPGPVRPGP